MTISTSSSQVTLGGNGATTAFNFSFVAGVASNIQVIFTDAGGNQTILLSSQYTLFINPALAGQIWGIGGSVTYPISGSPIPSGTSLTILRIVPLTQNTTISNQGDFYPQVVEAALDTLCLEIQQVSARTGQLRGIWATDIIYNIGDIVTDGVNGNNTGNLYTCAVANTSGVWATDLANGDWVLGFNFAPFATAEAIAVAAATTATTQAGIATAAATTSTTEAGISTGGATTATTQAGIATAAATQASNYAVSYSGTSTTSQAIMTGTPTFTASTGKLWVGGQALMIASNANSANYMHGQVTSYNSGTGALVMNITDTGGSGTHTDWNISISGTQGPLGSLTSIADGDILSNISGGSASPIANSQSAILDHVFGNTQGDILYRGASNWAALAPGTAGKALISGGTAANPAWGSAEASLPSSNTYQATPGDPASTSSTSGVMMGFAGTITPNSSGKVLFLLSADGYTNNNAVQFSTQVRFGTGTAPVNGAALAGTAIGRKATTETPTAPADAASFSHNAVVTGLTSGTPYWFDLAVYASNAADSVNVINNSLSALEIK